MSEQLVEVKTIGEVEHLVHASGEWDGTGPVEFSDDGVTWVEAWSPSEDHPHPEFARVTVHRKGVTVPTRKTVRWDEQVPVASEEWAARWHASPIRHFSRIVRMLAFRETFRDILGNIHLEDEERQATAPAAPAVPAEAAPRDWAAEFAAAETVNDLDAIVKDARKARVFKPSAEGTALDRAWKMRRIALATAAAAPAVSADDLAEASVTIAKAASSSVDDWPTAPVEGRPGPKDFQRSVKAQPKRRKNKRRGRR